jgi:hypothetical protein
MEMIIAGYLSSVIGAILNAQKLSQKTKSPLSASGLKSFTALLYNCAPRSNWFGTAKYVLNRYPNHGNECVKLSELEVLTISIGFPLGR